MRLEQTIQLARYAEAFAKVAEIEHTAVRAAIRLNTKAIKSVVVDLTLVKGQAYQRHRLVELLNTLVNRLITTVNDEAKKIATDAALKSAELMLKESSKILSWDGRATKLFNNVELTAEQLLGMSLAMQGLAAAGVDDALTMAAIDKAREAMVRGVNPKRAARELVKELRDANAKIARDIESIIRTFCARAANLAHQAVCEANNDVIKEYEWSAILESANTSTGRGTCARCMALDGMTYNTIQDAPPVPLHMRCRCMLLPVTKSWRSLGIDADEARYDYRHWYDRKGKARVKVDHGYTDKDYPEWFLSRGKEWQINAIGRRRWEYVNEGRSKNAKLARFKRLVVADQKRADALGGKYRPGDLVLLRDL